ncbi:carbohydrate ABC transporter permease [Rhizobium sp. NRK18]|jgi:raffinose/stachyose/melibiose transport system permease protein|uniref:carbohydrate ABC transporter permease n=1 Tax=Rhizobium sp. NRK18 TaxID=2964667 RepID=UPI0021C2CADD|nr:sugar ABC transporter permease [Rhizobium sp. NRK18]MCQ2006023.1 sugar ABC transporter permease [Rhizobium sp. NRK18]
MSNQKPIIHRLGLRESILFFGPLALMFAVYYVFSTGFLFYTSLQRISMSLVNGKWIGLQNFVLLFTDHRFLKAFVNNLVFAGVSIGAALTLGFFIAVTLSATWRARTLLYTIFLLPALMPLSLVASVFRTLLEARFGSVNVLLSDIGLGWMAQNWLIDPTLAYGVVIILFVYIIGLPVLYYTANLSTINTSLIESAVIDGAGTWRLFVEILFPIMKGTHRTIVISTLLTSFRAFDIVFFSTGGGPAGATEITGTYVYAFSTTGANVGYGSAAAIATLLVTLVLSAIHMRFSGKDRHQ